MRNKKGNRPTNHHCTVKDESILNERERVYERKAVNKTKNDETKGRQIIYTRERESASAQSNG